MQVISIHILLDGACVSQATAIEMNGNVNGYLSLAILVAGAIRGRDTLVLNSILFDKMPLNAKFIIHFFVLKIKRLRNLKCTYEH